MKKSWSAQLIWSAIVLSVFAVVACGQKKEENNGKPVPSAQKNKVNPVTTGTTVTGGTTSVTAGTSGAPVPPVDGAPVTAGTAPSKPASPTSGTNSGITEGIVNNGTGENANSSVKATLAKKSILVNFTKFKKTFDDKTELIHISFIIGIDGVSVGIDTDIKQTEIVNKEFTVAGDKVSLKGNLRCSSKECDQLFVNVELTNSAETRAEVQLGAIKSFTSIIMDPKGKSDQMLFLNQIDLTKADTGPMSLDDVCGQLTAIVSN